MAFQGRPTLISRNGGGEGGKTWLPRSLQPVTLLIFLLITLAIIIFLEELLRVSLRDGALASTHPERGFSLTVMFSYQILPTISTVIYSLA